MLHVGGTALKFDLIECTSKWCSGYKEGQIVEIQLV